MTEVKTLPMDSVIQPNTQFYVHNGHYTQYFVEDYLTGELVMVIYPEGKPEVIKIEEGITYKELNPNHNGTVYFMTEGLNPFSSTDFVTTTLGIYRVHLEERVSYISSDMNKLYDEVLFKLENLATGGYQYAKFSEIHQPKTKKFYNDLYNLYTVGYPMIQAFIKGLIYNKEYADSLSYGETLRATKDLRVLKELFSNTKYGYFATPGGYNYDGSDYQFFTQLSEDGTLVTIKKFFYPTIDGEPCRLVAEQVLNVKDFQDEIAELAVRNMGAPFSKILTLFAEGSGFFFPTSSVVEKMPTNYIEDFEHKGE